MTLRKGTTTRCVRVSFNHRRKWTHLKRYSRPTTKRRTANHEQPIRPDREAPLGTARLGIAQSTHANCCSDRSGTSPPDSASDLCDGEPAHYRGESSVEVRPSALCSHRRQLRVLRERRRRRARHRDARRVLFTFGGLEHSPSHYADSSAFIRRPSSSVWSVPAGSTPPTAAKSADHHQIT
uniref:Uncharacterized protein n=1 Tax=Plectus sambesii TaxID=2011161 RepID=A0A914WVU5_9BILA